MKYIHIVSEEKFGSNRCHTILTEEELHNLFMDDSTVRHSDENYEVWKKIRTDIDYADGMPEWLPFDEVDDHASVIDIEPVLVKTIANMLETMGDTVGEDHMTHASWTLTFNNGDGKSIKLGLGFLSQIFEPMELFLHDLIDSVVNY